MSFHNIGFVLEIIMLCGTGVRSSVSMTSYLMPYEICLLNIFLDNIVQFYFFGSAGAGQHEKSV